MVQTTLKVDGMMCGMCESHVNEVVDIEALKAAIADTGYTVTGAEEKPYEKKGFFSFLKH